MKDRIRQIMESQHMTQQVFADFIGIAPATLSGIFTERTKPTINTIEAIKKKLPSVSTDWLMFGKEPMYIDPSSSSVDPDVISSDHASPSPSVPVETVLDFQSASSPTPHSPVRQVSSQNVVKNTRLEMDSSNMNNIDKRQRRVTEIRVFYDDQTWESFVPQTSRR